MLIVYTTSVGLVFLFVFIVWSPVALRCVKLRWSPNFPQCIANVRCYEHCRNVLADVIHIEHFESLRTSNLVREILTAC